MAVCTFKMWVQQVENLVSWCLIVDYLGVKTGSCSMEDIACKVMTTVISHKPEAGHLVVDCGWTAIGQDGLWLEPKDAPLGICPIEGHPELR